MAYQINKFNGEAGSILVEDGTINTTLDIKLIGKNYSGYGEAQNENFLHLLENFARDSAPVNAIVGQLWYNTDKNKLQVNYGVGQWRTVGILEVVTSATEPVTTDLNTGDLWWNTDTSQLYCKGIATSVLIGGAIPEGSTHMKTSEVTDTANTTHQIIEAVVAGVTSFVISKSDTFTLKSTEELKQIGAGYHNLHKGITLHDFDSLTNTSTTGGYKFWGTATDSDQLGGFAATEYVNQSNPIFTNPATFSEDGFSVNNRLTISNEFNGISFTPTIFNADGDTIAFKTTGDTATNSPLTLKGNDVLPGTPDVSNIGSADELFDTIYGNTFSGTANAANNLVYASTVVAVDEEASSGTIPIRSTDVTLEFRGRLVGDGSIFATNFCGDGFFADDGVNTGGGDVAENYLADEVYETGTVLMIGGNSEVTAAKSGTRAIGAISVRPALLMNMELENGTSVALKGRVPVSVIGVVKKGDRLVAADTGVARSLTDQDDSSLVFAIALEDNVSNNAKLIEALVL